jgi:ribosomal protein L22
MSAEMRKPPEGGWESLKVDELKAELEARGLPKSGKKDELIARLADDDLAQEGNVVEAPAEEAAKVEEAAAEEAPKPARRRGSAETSAPAESKKAAPRRDANGDVVVRARSRYVRSAPRKARLVMDHIRGKEVEQARAILSHTPRHAGADILKLLNSAVANAESAYELGPDELRIARAFVDEGPTIKRFRPRALGRATQIKKRTSHMTIELTTTANGR